MLLAILLSFVLGNNEHCINLKNCFCKILSIGHSLRDYHSLSFHFIDLYYSISEIIIMFVIFIKIICTHGTVQFTVYCHISAVAKWFMLGWCEILIFMDRILKVVYVQIQIREVLALLQSLRPLFNLFFTDFFFDKIFQMG